MRRKERIDIAFLRVGHAALKPIQVDTSTLSATLPQMNASEDLIFRQELWADDFEAKPEERGLRIDDGLVVIDWDYLKRALAYAQEQGWTA